jgi:hypothetical protein
MAKAQRRTTSARPRVARRSHERTKTGTTGPRSTTISGVRRTTRAGPPVVVVPAIELPRVRRRRSHLDGWGVFALEDIPKNKRIIVYQGERIPTRESAKREERYLRRGHIWCFRVNRAWAVDGSVDGNNARFINHSCTPNCYSQIIDGVVWIRAGKNIAAGDELTYNYYTDGSGHIQCRCRPGCRNKI